MGRREATSLEAKISRLLGYENAVVFGRARAGLVAAIEETTDPDAPVIIPSNACSALLAAVIATGRRPVLASVSAETGLVDDSVLSGVIEGHNGPPGLALVTHLYGMVTDYPLTEVAARRLGWHVFENDSLAATALLPANSRFSIGKGLLVSFGSGKTLDGGGGGADPDRDPHEGTGRSRGPGGRRCGRGAQAAPTPAPRPSNESTNGSLKQTNHAPHAAIRARPVPATPTSSVFCRNSRQQTSYLSVISRHRWAHGTCGQTEPLAYPGNATRQAVLIKRTTLGASAHRAGSRCRQSSHLRHTNPFWYYL